MKNITLGNAIGMMGVVGLMASQFTAAMATQTIENYSLANPQANAPRVGDPVPDPAALVGSRFTYQGSLNLDGSPANGLFDMSFVLYGQTSGGSPLGVNNRLDQSVENGLFATELDFGEVPINGDDIFLEMRVRPAGSGSFTVLSPRQRINATPYAVRALTSGGANTGQWSINGSAIYYSAGPVGIGTSTPSAMLEIAAGNSSPQKIVDVKLNGTTRFSVQTNGGTTVGLGPPSAIGTAPVNGLAVLGTTRHWGDVVFQSDVRQSVSAKGALKASAFIYCGGNNGTLGTIYRSAQHVSGSGISPMVLVNRGIGDCDIDLGFDISQRYWQATVVVRTGGTYGPATVRCFPKNNTTSVLSCLTHLYNSGDSDFHRFNESIMLMIY